MVAIVHDPEGRLHGGAPCAVLDEAPMMDLSAAEAVLLDPKSTRDELMNASHAFSFSPDPDHRAYGREVLAALWAMGGGEMVTPVAESTRARVKRAEQRFDDAVSRRRAEIAEYDDRRSSLPLLGFVFVCSVFGICFLAYAFASFLFG